MTQTNKEFLDSLNEEISIESSTEYSNIRLNNLANIELMVPKANEDYWNLVIFNRRGLIQKLKACKSQYVFEIFLKDMNESFNKLTDKEKEIYLQ